MGKRVVEPRFIQIEHQTMALAHIVAVDVHSPSESPTVDVYLVAPVSGGGWEGDFMPNCCTFVGDAAERFLDFWRRYDGVRVL